jgi:adenylate cyclase
MSGSNASDLIGRWPDRRKLIAVVYADMVGYSRLIGLDDAGTLHRLRTLRREVIDPAIEEHGGRLVQTGGDSLLIVFDSIDGAVRCAVNVQQQVPDCDGDQPHDRAIRFRIGINIGDAIADGTDLHGDAVNVAARLQAECPPGGICVSRAVWDHVQDRLKATFEELGALDLKNIARPVEAFLLRLDAHAQHPKTADTTNTLSPGRDYPWSMPTQRLNLVDRPSLIVLPFDSIGDERFEGHLADGITEDLTTDLSRTPGINVIARNVAFAFKAKPIDLGAIRSKLGIRYVLHGSVRQISGRVRVTANLADTETGVHLWADRLDIDLIEHVDAQNEVTGRLVRAVRFALVADANRRISAGDLTGLGAKELVLRARAASSQPISRETYETVRDYYERALALDPGLADAQIGAAGVLLGNVADGWSASPQEDIMRSEQLIGEAVSQNPNQATARLVAGVLRRLQNRLAESHIDLKTAIALEPENATAHCQLGYTLLCLGDPEAAIVEIERGIRLGPQEAHTPVSHCMLGLSHLMLGNVDQAIELLRTACAANPRLYYVYLGLAAALALKDDLHNARAALAEAIKLRPGIGSLASFRATHPWATNPRHMDLAARTLDIGLMRAGMPAD